MPLGGSGGPEGGRWAGAGAELHFKLLSLKESDVAFVGVAVAGLNVGGAPHAPVLVVGRLRGRLCDLQYRALAGDAGARTR